MAKMSIDDLVSQMQLAFGAELRAVVLYGSAARESGAPTAAGQNVLIVVDRITMDTLTKEAAIGAAWSEAGHPPLLTMTLDEWRGSADIFPIEYADLLEAHKVLHGTLPLDGVRVERSDLRLHLEHEAMGKLLRLRRGILAARGESKRQIALLAESVGAFVVLFRALLRVTGETPPHDAESLTTAAAKRAGFDAEPFQRALRHARGTQTIGAGEASALLGSYLAGATQLAHHIDRMGAT
jgi:hypothetical protein